MRVTSKGQVTIPQDVRESAGLMPGSEVEFVVEKGVVILRKAKSGRKPTRGQRMVERLRGAGTYSMSASEVIALMRGPAADADAPGGKR